MGYTLNNGVVKINEIWLKKIWEITCKSKKYDLRTQIKQGKIYNIRPYNFKTGAKGFQPFKSKLDFVNGIKETFAKSSNDTLKAAEWFIKVEESHKKFTRVSL